jgi:hypothetical protein
MREPHEQRAKRTISFGAPENYAADKGRSLDFLYGFVNLEGWGN